MVDWRKVYEFFDEAPEELKERIRKLFEEKEREGKLKELFEKEPYAEKLYKEKIKPPPKPVIVPPTLPREFPRHKYLSDEDVKQVWEEFLAYLKLRLPEIEEPRVYKDRFFERIKTAKAKYEAINKAKRLVEEIVREKARITAPPPPGRPWEREVRTFVERRYRPLAPPFERKEAGVCPICGSRLKAVQRTEYNPTLGDWVIMRRLVCARNPEHYKTDWEMVGFLA